MLGVTVVQGDTNGDRIADFAIDLVGNIVLIAGDFIGVIPPGPVVIEALGSTSLVQANGNYYLNNISTGTGPTVKYAGAAVGVGQFDVYVPVAAEQTAGGYLVALQYSATNQFSIWNTDSSGNFLSYSVYSGASTVLKSLETSFQQDLNGDGVIGAPLPRQLLSRR